MTSIAKDNGRFGGIRNGIGRVVGSRKEERALLEVDIYLEGNVWMREDNVGSSRERRLGSRYGGKGTRRVGSIGKRYIWKERLIINVDQFITYIERLRCSLVHIYIFNSK